MAILAGCDYLAPLLGAEPIVQNPTEEAVKKLLDQNITQVYAEFAGWKEGSR